MSRKSIKNKNIISDSTQEKNIDDKVKIFMSQFMGDNLSEESKKKGLKLEKAFEELEKCFVQREYRGFKWFQDNGFQQYSDGSKIPFYHMRQNSYQKAFHTIQKILNIVRNETSEIIFYTYQDGKLTVRRADESKIKTSRTKFKIKNPYTGQSWFTEKLILLQSSLQEVSVSEAFTSHYEKYSEIAKNHIEKNNLGSKYRSLGGYTAEAFEQHLNHVHKGISYSSEDFNENIDPQEVAIEIYYAARNKAGWWTAGDVGLKQIKFGNTTIGSYSSIKNVANELIAMYKNPEKFTLEQFNSLFNMTNESIVDWEEIKDSLDDKIVSDMKDIQAEFSKTF